MKAFIEFKEKKNEKLFYFLHPVLIGAIADMALWINRNSLSCIITDTISTHIEDVKLKRVSASHRQRRALDMSSKNWPDKLIKDFEATFNEKYKSIGSISQKDLKPRMVLYHNNGNGAHFHIALNATYSLGELNEADINGIIS
jgi:hypothetical protein